MKWTNKGNEHYIYEQCINNLKNGVKYNVMEKKQVKLEKNDASPVNMLINLVGDNMIEYK